MLVKERLVKERCIMDEGRRSVDGDLQTDSEVSPQGLEMYGWRILKPSWWTIRPRFDDISFWVGCKKRNLDIV